jgi:predicted molibdopterin-dependent oxidoreductase YjgC
MFKDAQLSRPDLRTQCTVWVDGCAVQARAGEPLAAALLRAAVVPMRHSVVSGSPRAPLCMMGVCFECLVELDGVPNVQACMTPVVDGMRVRLQHGARAVGVQA